MTTAIDFILTKTKYSKLDIVGYSLGTTIALVGLSDRPEYNSKIHKLILMAPTSRLKSSGAPINIFRIFSKPINVNLNRIFPRIYYGRDFRDSRLLRWFYNEYNTNLYFQTFLNGINFFPYTENPDISYQLIRRLCSNERVFIYCRRFIDMAQGIILPMNKVCNATLIKT